MKGVILGALAGAVVAAGSVAVGVVLTVMFLCAGTVGSEVATEDTDPVQAVTR